MPALSPLGNRLLQGLQAKHRTVVTTRPQCVVELPETWAAYLSQLSSKERGDVGLRTKFSQVSEFFRGSLSAGGRPPLLFSSDWMGALSNNLVLSGQIAGGCVCGGVEVGSWLTRLVRLAEECAPGSSGTHLQPTAD
jgi:hypothetical protein